MVSLRTATRRGPSAMPPHLTTLSVSWLNKQFKAMAVHRGAMEGTWEYPGEIEGTSHFEALIREAVQKTNYRGQTVSLLLGHQRLVQQVLDLPPVKGATFNKLIERQALQQKFFVGEAACAHQTSVALKGNQRVILHLFPKILLGQLIQGCRHNGLHLMSVTPPSAVVHEQMAQLPLVSDETTLLAAETAGSITLVIARADGAILLCRTLPGTWNEDADRMALDINRTLLFANQQYGAVVSRGIWLFGRGAKEKAPAIQRQVQLPVQVSPADDNPFYWATEALKLRPGFTPNFISSQMQRAPQRRVFAKVVLAGTLLVFLGSLGVSAYAYLQARQEEATIRSLTMQYGKLQERQMDLLKRIAELNRKRGVAKLVVDDRVQPVPAWFLAYLGECVPQELVITNLQVGRESDDTWRFQLAGTSQETGRRPSPGELAASVEMLRMRLANGPFHAALTNPGEKEREEQANKNAPGAPLFSWVTKVATAPPTNAPPSSDFHIEGVMR